MIVQVLHQQYVILKGNIMTLRRRRRSILRPVSQLLSPPDYRRLRSSKKKSVDADPAGRSYYYSTYRKKSFDPNHWKIKLSKYDWALLFRTDWISLFPGTRWTQSTRIRPAEQFLTCTATVKNENKDLHDRGPLFLPSDLHIYYTASGCWHRQGAPAQQVIEIDIDTDYIVS